MRVLFVCLGNICRSPLAEAIVRNRAEERGLAGRFSFASAGTGDWHIGLGADPRAIDVAERHGLSLQAHRARQITGVNIRRWHVFVAMDQDNRDDLLAMGVEAEHLWLMRQFEGHEPPADVPDPYYGGGDGFDTVFALLQKNADPLLDCLLAARTG